MTVQCPALCCCSARLLSSAAQLCCSVRRQHFPTQQFAEPLDETAAQQARTVSNALGVGGRAEGEYSSNNTGKVSKRHSIRTLSHAAAYLVGIKMDQDFNVMRRLIGPSAEHIKLIMKATKGVKVHIRGLGSKQQDAEAEDDPVDSGPLTIFIRAPSSPKLERAAALVEKLLRDVHQQHRDHLRHRLLLQSLWI